MSNQRDLFYGKKRKRSRKKSPKVEPVCNRRFRGIQSQEISVRFDNETVTAHGGYTLLRQFLKAVKFRRLFARFIRILKRSNGYTIPEMGSFVIDTKFLGCDRLMHVETLRFDPLLTQSYGINSLPAGKTCGSYLKSYEPQQIRTLDRLNVYTNRELTKRALGGKYRLVTVDYDSSTMAVYGKQEGADRGRSFRKKDSPGFQPKFAFIGGLDLMVNQKLYPESFNLAKDFRPFHEETMKKIPRVMRVVAVRGDGSLYSEKNAEYFEGQGYRYGISASMNAPLREAVCRVKEEDWLETTDERGRPVSIARITYRPKTWEKARTFIISRRLKSGGKVYFLPEEQYKYFAYVTNKRGEIFNVYKFCVNRCSLERCIKEAKLGFDMDSLPCKDFTANQAYMGHVQLAYNLMIFFKLLAMPKGINRWTIDTIRRRLISIPGDLYHRGGEWVLSLPRYWPFQDLFRFVEGRLVQFEFG